MNSNVTCGWDVNMYIIKWNWLTVLACVVVLPTKADITVSSFEVGAGTNAFAPLSGDQYFQRQTLQNTSLAICDAAGIWSGTNIGGLSNTWHWVGSAHVTINTTQTGNFFSASGEGSYSRDLTTTPDFFDPGRVATQYAPGSSVGYNCVLTVDAEATYYVSTQLARYANFRLYSKTNNLDIVNVINVSTIPQTMNRVGALQPGEYTMNVGAGIYGLSFIQGAAHEVRSGSFTNFNFTVSVPEPALLGALGFGGLFLRRRRWSV